MIKWPLVDFIVELLGAARTTPYFFVQVRNTRQGLTSGDRRLRVQLREGKVRQLVSYPAPTYIVGVDEREERAYIVSANGENLTSMCNMSTRFPMNKRNRSALWKEVNDFWAARPKTAFVSRFADPEWR